MTSMRTMSANIPAIPPIRAGRGNVDSVTGVDEVIPCVVGFVAIVVYRKWVMSSLLI